MIAAREGRPPSFVLRPNWLAVLLLALLLGTGGCAGSGESQKPPDERYGHRYADGEGPEGRATLAVTPPTDGASYFTYPVPIGSVTVRAAATDSLPTDSAGRVPVDVLVKGALPNACMAMHEAAQEQSGHLIRARLSVRQSQGAVCRRLRRPYRFYLSLGPLAPGDYSLLLNGDFYAFTVNDPPS